MPGAKRRPFRLHLAWLLSFVVTSVFVTTLIAATGDLATLWPLYIISIVIASLGYHAAGGALSIAITVASVALLSYSANSNFVSLSALLTGLATYAIVATVIGIQAQRSASHKDAVDSETLRDAVTGEFTREHLELLSLELRRAQRYEWKTSFVLFRVAAFKEFRHKFGRIKSDQLLARLAQVIRLNVRGTDIVGCWDNDSFGVLMQLADREEAAAIALRVVAACAATEFEGDALEPTTHCEFEMGSATYPDDASDLDALVTHASERLSKGAVQAT